MLSLYASLHLLFSFCGFAVYFALNWTTLFYGNLGISIAFALFKCFKTKCLLWCGKLRINCNRISFFFFFPEHLDIVHYVSKTVPSYVQTEWPKYFIVFLWIETFCKLRQCSVLTSMLSFLVSPLAFLGKGSLRPAGPTKQKASVLASLPLSWGRQSRKRCHHRQFISCSARLPRKSQSEPPKGLTF